MLTAILFRVSLPSDHLSKNFKIYKTITLPVLLYVCGTWFLTLKEGWFLREEHKLQVFEDILSRKMFGTSRDEVSGEI
jgi:hypothetical protein